MSKDNLPEKISPEGVRAANKYLESSMNMDDTAKELGIERHEVSELLNTPMVKEYVNGVLAEVGFRQMDKLQGIMDKIIDAKMEELDEAEMTSSKDIVEIITAAAKLAESRLKALDNREKKNDKIVNQKNTQFNLYDSNSNYGKLMEAIATGKEI
jgi:vacuolar-type H+-ATPase subunit H